MNSKGKRKGDEKRNTFCEAITRMANLPFVEICQGENSMRYGGNSSSMVRAACKSAVAKPSVNRS